MSKQEKINRYEDIMNRSSDFKGNLICSEHIGKMFIGINIGKKKSYNNTIMECYEPYESRDIVEVRILGEKMYEIIPIGISRTSSHNVMETKYKVIFEKVVPLDLWIRKTYMELKYNK